MEKKFLSAVLAGLLVVSGSAVTAYAEDDTPVETEGMPSDDGSGEDGIMMIDGEDDGEGTETLSGWQEIDGEMYYFDPEDGTMVKNRYVRDDGKLYMIDEDGHSALKNVGWNKITFNGEDNGWTYAYTGMPNYTIPNKWILDNGKWYYIGDGGRMLSSNTFPIDGKLYLFEASGAMVDSVGWYKSKGRWYYIANKNGECSTGWKLIGGKWYCFDEVYGYMYEGCGCKDESGNVYYLDDSGVWNTTEGWHSVSRGLTWCYVQNEKCLTGKQVIGGKEYMFNEYGGMMTDAHEVDGVQYLYGEDGARITKAGWQTLYGYWYYLNANGTVKMGWHEENGKTYYLDKWTGRMTRGPKAIDGVNYLFASTGEKIGEIETNEAGETVIAGNVVKPEWNTFGNEKFYMDDYGFANGPTNVGGTYYMFNGYAKVEKKGWVKYDALWYYVNADTTLASGWVNDGGKWYYMGDVNELYFYSYMHSHYWVKSGNSWYYLKDNGVMADNEWIYDEDKWYYLEKGGAMAANKWIGNYYLQGDGSMATNKWIGNWYVGADGAWVPNKR